jgi:hypothetical protein
MSVIQLLFTLCVYLFSDDASGNRSDEPDNVGTTVAYCC